MASFQTPNMVADPGAGPQSRGATYSASAFAREASAYTRYLRRAYRERLLAGDDAGVASIARSARTVERAAVVHASAATLASVRGRTHDDPSAAADAAAAKEYLAGVQSRLADALRARDVHTLERVADAADAAMHALVNPDAAFAEVSHLPLMADADSAHPADNIDDGEYDLYEGGSGDGSATGAKRSQTSMISYIFPWMAADAGFVSGTGGGRRRRGCCGFLAAMNTTDRVVVVVYLLMLCAALVAVGFITAQFVNGVKNPESFLRPRQRESLPVPVVTLCLSQSGVPFSRFQIFNFTDAKGTSFRGADPQGAYKERSSKDFDQVVERFWDNPGKENCEAQLGDFFPLPAAKLNELTVGKKVSRCRPCYRMGSKRKVIARSTAFTNSSFIHAFTDNYFLECLKRPGGLTDKSVTFLHKLIKKIIDKDDRFTQFNVLARENGGSLKNLTLPDIEKLNGKQQCNIFYFGLFPKQLGKLPKTNTDVRYVYLNNGSWVNRGTGTQFEPPVAEESNFFPLESLQLFVSSNESTERGSLKGQRDMALIGPNTQTYASFKPLLVYNNSRYDVQTSTSNFIDSDVAVLFGYWLSYRIFYNYNRFITDEYYLDSTYSFSQWFVDFTGYLSLFTGASLFSVFLLPVLYSVRMRQRKKLKNENPEAYFWRKYRKHFGLARFSHASAAGAAGPSGVVDDAGGRNVQLPGYSV